MTFIKSNPGLCISSLAEITLTFKFPVGKANSVYLSDMAGTRKSQILSVKN